MQGHAHAPLDRKETTGGSRDRRRPERHHVDPHARSPCQKEPSQSDGGGPCFASSVRPVHYLRIAHETPDGSPPAPADSQSAIPGAPVSANVLRARHRSTPGLHPHARPQAAPTDSKSPLRTFQCYAGGENDALSADAFANRPRAVVRPASPASEAGGGTGHLSDRRV